MPILTMTREIAYALGTDAANRQMREAGRKAWSVDDYNLAVRTMNEAWPLEAEYPWMTEEQADEVRAREAYHA